MVKLLSFLIALMCCIAHATVGAQTELGSGTVYSVIEISFTGPTQTTSSVPNKDINFWVDFQHASGSPSYRVHGFWDGNGNGGSSGNVFKVRFCPTQTGQWNLIDVFSNATELNNEKEGDYVTATVSSHPGFWIVDGASNGSRWYKRSNGEHQYIVSNTHYDFLSESAGTISGDVSGNAQYFKKLRFSVTGDRFPNPSEKPFFNTSGQQTDDGAYSVRTNPAWFHNRLDQAIGQAYSLDLVMDLILAGPDAYDARETLKATGNNGDPEPYLKYIAARYGAYPNVWICLANEYDIKNPSYTTTEIKTFGQIIKQYLPYPTPLSVHPNTGTGWQTGLNTTPMWADHKIIQSKDKTLASGAGPITSNYNVTPANMPVFNDETGYEGAGDNFSEADIIEGHMGVLSGGGYPCTGYKPIPKEGQYFQGGFNATEHAACDNLKYMREVIDANMTFWNYEPQSATSSIFSGLSTDFKVLQWANNEYVLFSNAADATITAALPSGSWSIYQYNCINKATSTISTNASGSTNFATPASRACMTFFKKNQSSAPSITFPAPGTVLMPGQSVTAQGSGTNLQWNISVVGGGNIATGSGNSIAFVVPLNASTSTDILIQLSNGNQTVSQTHDVNDTAPNIQAITVTPSTGTPFSIQLTATGNSPSLTWQLTGSLPYGITLSSIGQLEGTVPSAQTITIPVQVTDADGDVDTDNLSLQIVAQAPPFCEAGGQLVMEAENFHSNNTNGDFVAWSSATAFAGYSGTGYMQTPENGSANSVWSESADLSYSVNFNTIGTYSIWLRRRQIGGGANSAYVGRNGTQIGNSIDNGSGAGWVWVKHTSTLSVTTIGQATFNLRRREDGYQVDKILLTTNAAFTPTATGPTESPRCASCPLVTATTATNPTCSGATDGSATATATSGTAPYTFIWSNGATTSAVSGLASGTYTVTVTDAANCTASATAVLTAPSALTATITATNPTGGNANGAANLSTSGGTIPYAYFWSNGATTQNITGLVEGSYTVTVTDGNNCTQTASATLSTATGPCTFQEVGGVLALEAENFSTQQQQSDPLVWMPNTAYAGAVGGTYMWTPDNATANMTYSTGARLIFNVNIATAGTYNVYARRYALSASSNGARMGTDATALTGSDGGSNYNQWVWVAFSSRTLSAGAHTIHIVRIEDGYAVDRIVLTTGAAPTGTGPAASACTNFSSTIAEDRSADVRLDVPEPLRIFPNPTSGLVHVEWVQEAGPITLSLVDGVGKTIITQNASNPAGINAFDLDLSKLPAGIYFARLHDEKGWVRTQRFVKQ